MWNFTNLKGENMARKKSKLLEVGKEMPLLYHRFPDEEYDPTQSQVLEWISKQPELMEWIFAQLKSTGYIVYDSQWQAWRGVGNHD